MNAAEFKQFIEKKLNPIICALGKPKADRFELNEQLFNICRDERRQFTHAQRLQIRETLFNFCQGFVFDEKVSHKLYDSLDNMRERYLVTLAACYLNGWGTPVNARLAFQILCVFDERKKFEEYPYEFTVYWWEVYKGVFDEFNKQHTPEKLRDIAVKQIMYAALEQEDKLSFAMILVATNPLSKFSLSTKFQTILLEHEKALLKSSYDEAPLTYAKAASYKLPYDSDKEKRKLLKKRKDGVKRAVDKSGSAKAHLVLSREYILSQVILPEKKVNERRKKSLPHLCIALAAGYGEAIDLAKHLFRGCNVVGAQELKEAIVGMLAATSPLHRFRNLNGLMVCTTHNGRGIKNKQETSESMIHVWAQCMKQMPADFDNEEKLERAFIYLLVAASRLYNSPGDEVHLATKLLNGICDIDPEAAEFRDQLLVKQITANTLEAIIAELAGIEAASAPPLQLDDLVAESEPERTSSSSSSSGSPQRFFYPQKTSPYGASPQTNILGQAMNASAMFTPVKPPKSNKQVVLPAEYMPSAPPMLLESAD